MFNKPELDTIKTLSENRNGKCLYFRSSARCWFRCWQWLVGGTL